VRAVKTNNLICRHLARGPAGVSGARPLEIAPPGVPGSSSAGRPALNCSLFAFLFHFNALMAAKNAMTPRLREIAAAEIGGWWVWRISDQCATAGRCALSSKLVPRKSARVCVVRSHDLVSRNPFLNCRVPRAE
jgi:hypothetical protein